MSRPLDAAALAGGAELAPRVGEAECSDHAGRTCAMAALRAGRRMVLHYEPTEV